ncbi:MAG: hypothetical protein GY749_10585 [Desulfobacteraceae bacterium]|nr:hypothetical protein [Desulfobacteraceae bacterium]
MTGQGKDNVFNINQAETLSASELKSWLDALQDNTPIPVILIYDADDSFSFVKELEPTYERTRVLIASTEDTAIYEDTSSFSNCFWRNVLNGIDIRDSFEYAESCVAQKPQMDVNGNGIFNEKEDRIYARNYTIGIGILLATANIYQPILPDEHEEDNTFSQARIIIIDDEPQNHNFHSADDEDWIKFYGIADAGYGIRISNVGENCDPMIEIYDDGQTMLLDEPWDKKDDGEEELLKHTFDKDGIYYIRLRHADSEISEENMGYSVRIYRTIGPPSLIHVTGKITDSETGEPINGATIKTDANVSGLSLPDGDYLILHEEGTFKITAGAFRYESVTREEEIFKDKEIDFELDPLKINGTVLYNGTPLCAMVLANGQYMFSCAGQGKYELKPPPDQNGEITLFAFVDGFEPFKKALVPEEAKDFDINMTPDTGENPEMSITVDYGISADPDKVIISGSVMYNETPLCAMVLANGQHMFSCAGNGEYELEVPLNDKGQITLFGFVDGFQPFKMTLTPYDS